MKKKAKKESGETTRDSVKKEMAQSAGAKRHRKPPTVTTRGRLLRKRRCWTLI